MQRLHSLQSIGSLIVRCHVQTQWNRWISLQILSPWVTLESCDWNCPHPLDSPLSSSRRVSVIHTCHLSYSSSWVLLLSYAGCSYITWCMNKLTQWQCMWTAKVCDSGFLCADMKVTVTRFRATTTWSRDLNIGGTGSPNYIIQSLEAEWKCGVHRAIITWTCPCLGWSGCFA